MQIVPCLLCVVFCFCLSESVPITSSSLPSLYPSTTSATMDDEPDALDILVKAALIFAFFVVTLICCIIKCQCFDSSSRSNLSPPFRSNTGDIDQERLRNNTDRTRTESQGYPFAPASPPPVLEAYMGVMEGHAHPLGSRHLPPPPSYIEALQYPKKPRLNSETWSELSRS